MKNIIGRESEKKKLSKILNSNEAEFLAIYGRRRVGKTFLINEFFQGRGLYFEVTGQKDAGLKMQLENFHQAVEEAFKPTLPIKNRNKKTNFSFNDNHHGIKKEFLFRRFSGL